MFKIDIILAALVAAPWLLNFLFGWFFRSFDRKSQNVYIFRVYRWLDKRSGHRMEQLAWVAMTWLTVRGVLALHHTLPPLGAWLWTGAIVVVWLFIAYPVIVLMGLFIEGFCERKEIFHDKNRYFPGHEALEKDWLAIRDEFDQFCELLPLRRMEELITDMNIERSDDPTRKWRAIFVRMGSVNIEATLSHFPTLRKHIDRSDISLTVLSVLDPGVELVPHRGYYNGILRYHLGLHVPEPELTRLEVGEKTYHWQEGEGVIFDDMYVHSAYNHSDKPRVVLFIDLNRRLPGPLWFINQGLFRFARWHPMLAYWRRKSVELLGIEGARRNS